MPPCWPPYWCQYCRFDIRSRRDRWIHDICSSFWPAGNDFPSFVRHSPVFVRKHKLFRVNKIFNGFDDVFVKIELDDTQDFLLSFKECEAYDDSISSRPTWPLITDGSSDGAEILQNYGKNFSLFHANKNLFRQHDLLQFQSFRLPRFQPERSTCIWRRNQDSMHGLRLRSESWSELRTRRSTETKYRRWNQGIRRQLFL